MDACSHSIQSTGRAVHTLNRLTSILNELTSFKKAMGVIGSPAKNQKVEEKAPTACHATISFIITTTEQAAIPKAWA